MKLAREIFPDAQVEQMDDGIISRPDLTAAVVRGDHRAASRGDRLSDARLERPDGVELHWEERGEGPPVVLAPYWSGHPGVYEDLLSDLARDHRVVDLGRPRHRRVHASRPVRHGDGLRRPRGDPRATRAAERS